MTAQIIRFPLRRKPREVEPSATSFDLSEAEIERQRRDYLVELRKLQKAHGITLEDSGFVLEPDGGAA